MLERQELLFAVLAATTVAVYPPYRQGRRRFVPPRYTRPLPRVAMPVPAQLNPPYPPAGVKHPQRVRALLPRSGQAAKPVPPQLLPPYPPAGVTTPEPLAVSTPFRALIPPGAAITRSSLADVVIVTQATPAPLVVSEPATPVRGTPPIIGRNTLQDPPVSTTPSPFVVSQPFRAAPVAAPTILRSSLQDFATPATPAPLVVVPPPVKPWNAPPLILRSSLADPIVVTGVSRHRSRWWSPPRWCGRGHTGP
jgi:hypothetical protein